MIRQDRFLSGILIGIALLVVLAVVASLLRQGATGYGPDDTPQGVFQNYILAISKGDYSRAFGYIGAPLPQPGSALATRQPTLSRFQQFFEQDVREQIANTGVQVSSSRVTGGTATLSVTLLQTSGDPFRSVYRQNQQAQLVVLNGAWKITQAPYPFWSYDWSEPQIKAPPPVPAPVTPIPTTPTR